jgi:small subunit ribosomal protein S17
MAETKAKKETAEAKPKATAPKAEPKPKAPKKLKAASSRAPKAIEPPRETVRKTRSGVVVSNKMSKTVVVEIERRTQHPLYGKVVIRSTKFKAHDEQGCDIGDKVEIMETRPISRDKRWRVTQILEKVK